MMVIEFTEKEISYLFERETTYRSDRNSYRIYEDSKKGFENYKRDLRDDHLHEKNQPGVDSDMKSLLSFMGTMNENYKSHGDNKKRD